MRATPAGLAIRNQSPGGVRMMDPKTGSLRWTWSRNDLGDGRDRMTVSADGKLLAAAFTTRDQHPRPPGLVVLDTSSGEVRATLPGNPGIPLAVTADQVITTHPNVNDLVAYGPDGTRRWTREKLPERIVTYDGNEFSDDGTTLLLAVDDEVADGRAKMLAIDLATGKDRWQLKTPRQMGYLHVVPGTDLAVVGGLDLPVSEDQDPTTSRVLAYRMTDGTKAWERTVPAPPGTSRDLDRNGCHAHVDLDADHLTLLTCGPYADALRLDAVRPKDGKPLWTQTIKTPNTGGPTPDGDDSMQAMPDGSTAMLMPAENGCSIVRADDSGLHKTPFRAVQRSCNTVEWYRAGGTVVLRDRDQQQYLALR